MERLTERMDLEQLDGEIKNIAYIKDVINDDLTPMDCDIYCRYIRQDKSCCGCPIQESFEKLANYEDLDMNPEDLTLMLNNYERMNNKIQKYENAEKEDRLFVLPCKVGTTIYPIFHCDTPCDDMPEDTEWAYFAYKADLKFLISNIDNFGKTVFLTEEEAMAKIKELGINKELEDGREG